MARSIIKCKIRVSFIANGEETKISTQSIKSILIERLYGQLYMPVIYISLSLKNELYDAMMEHENDGKFYVNIQKYNALSEQLSIKTDHIKGLFTYILPTHNPNYSEDLSPESSMDEAYKTLTIGLISMEIMNAAKTSFNGIFGNIDQYTMLTKATEGIKKLVMKKPPYNATFETIDIPPMPSKTKLLQFIFDKNPFYDTPFIFFMDFDRSYLIDLCGDYCDAEDGQLPNVCIDIRSIIDNASYTEGITVNGDSYQFYVNPANANISPNTAIDNIANQVVFVDDDYVQKINLNVNKKYGSNVKQSFKRGVNGILYKNMVESNTVAIEFVKENLDSTIITPNKKFILNSYEDHTEYTGLYTLLYKDEIISNVNNEFGFSMSVGLRRVGNVSKIGKKATKAAMKKNKTK